MRQAGAFRVFVDGISGRRFGRPGPSELVDHARAGDSLCVTRLDSPGRSLKELLETVENLKAHDIHLVSLEERFDTTSAGGELVFHVFGAIAHLERRLVSERTRDGIAAARRRGRRPGRPALDGETVSAAPTLLEAGLTAGQAGKQLGIGRVTAQDYQGSTLRARSWVMGPDVNSGYKPCDDAYGAAIFEAALGDALAYFSTRPDG